MRGPHGARASKAVWGHYLLIGVVPVLMAWLYLAASARGGGQGFPLDDSWIHVRFAQNLAAGRGFAFNPGEPSTGATSPLWILVLAGGLLAMRSPLVAAYVLGVALTIAACVVVYKIALTLLDNRGFALATALLTGITGPMTWASLSGMEPPLYTFLTLLGIYLYLLARAGARRPRFAWPAVLALAALARPECALVFVLALVDTWLLELARGGRRAVVPLLRATAAQVAVFAAFLLPVLIRNLVVSGQPFPSTLYAKTPPSGVFSPILSQIGAGEWASLGTRLGAVPRKWLVDVLETAAGNNPLLLVLFGVGVVEVVRLARRADLSHRSLLLPLIFIGTPLLVGVLAPVALPSFQEQRYATHLVPVFVVVGMLGAFRLVGLAGVRPRASRLRVWALGVLLALIAAGPLLTLRHRAQTYALGVKNINALQVAAAEWLRDNTPPDAIMAAQDVGAVGVISGRHVLDLGGLITPEVIPFRYDDARVLAYLERARPDYLVILPVDRPILSRRTDLFTPVQDFMIPKEELLTASSNYLVIYRTAWAGG